MSIRSVILAATALLATANAHIIMASPVPYSNDKIDNSPLSGAAQFPCKAQNGFTVTKMNAMKVGETQQISFKGSAVHGGGSCQLSYTQDTTPTANSKFKVIKSMEGGCPGVDGVKSFDFTLPDSIPSGKGTFAWTWFSKMAGQPELYMNCAPIEVSGGASDASKLSSLPDMLVANMASINTCKQVENKAIKFPNPGKSVQDGGLNDAVAPTGQCGASSGGSDSSSPSSGASSPSSAAGSAPSSAAGSAPSSAASSAPSSAAAQPTATGGGVFAPGASSSAAAEPTAAEPTAAAPTSVQPTTLATSAAATGSTPAATGSPSSGGSSSGTACTTNGAIVCSGTTKFGLCDNGNVVFQSVAAGTQCSNGAIVKRGYNGRIARPRAL